MNKFIIFFILALVILAYLVLTIPQDNSSEITPEVETKSYNAKLETLALMNVPLAVPNPVINETEHIFIPEDPIIEQNETVLLNESVELNETIELNETSITEYDYNKVKLNAKVLLEQERSIAKINENFGILMFYMCDYGVYPNPNIPNRTSDIMFGLARTYKLILTEMC